MWFRFAGSARCGFGCCLDCLLWLSHCACCLLLDVCVAGLIIVWFSWVLLFECCSVRLLMLVGLCIAILAAVTTCWLAVCLLWVVDLVDGVVGKPSVLLFDCVGIFVCSLLVWSYVGYWFGA